MTDFKRHDSQYTTSLDTRTIVVTIDFLLEKQVQLFFFFYCVLSSIDFPKIG